ncbi:hypothetical protein Droror1_Dr00028085 [Drosera rotundifolia]
MFQFAKFEKSKERRLATELGYGFPIGDPWITDGISPWPFASESVLPSQCPGIHPMHSFRSLRVPVVSGPIVWRKLVVALRLRFPTTKQDYERMDVIYNQPSVSPLSMDVKLSRASGSELPENP